MSGLCVDCDGDNDTGTWFCESCHRRHEARAKAILHAATTGEVVVGNLGPDGKWSLKAIAERATWQDPPTPPPAPARRHERLWPRILRWFGRTPDGR